MNVLDFDSIELPMKDVISKSGKIEVLMNNAGYGQHGLFEAISREKATAQFHGRDSSHSPPLLLGSPVLVTTMSPPRIAHSKASPSPSCTSAPTKTPRHFVKTVIPHGGIMVNCCAALRCGDASVDGRACLVRLR
ncbi:hypothetical protein BC835DRAFT_1425268 [Cytidiella melzeri]|nr:hypothetical protein BC835DRAFT_1425268 [Cytidiella melzeri]